MLTADLLGETTDQNGISFGSCMDRQIFPTHAPPTKFGTHLCPIRGAPHRGPGCYENEQQTNLEHKVDKFVTSSLGYTLGARTAPRVKKQYVELTPAPCDYQHPLEDQNKYTPQSVKPFLEGATRFSNRKAEISRNLPGPGTYSHDVDQTRKVQWHQSFGGRPIDLPKASKISTISPNTDKLVTTRDEKRYQKRLAYLKLYY